MAVIFTTKAQGDLSNIARFYAKSYNLKITQRKVAIVLAGIDHLEKQPISVGLATLMPDVYYWIVDITTTDSYLVYFKRVGPDLRVYRVVPARAEPLTPEEVI